MNPVSYLGIRIGSKWDTTTVEQGRRANIGLLSWVKYTSSLGHPLGLWSLSKGLHKNAMFIERFRIQAFQGDAQTQS